MFDPRYNAILTALKTKIENHARQISSPPQGTEVEPSRLQEDLDEFKRVETEIREAMQQEKAFAETVSKLSASKNAAVLELLKPFAKQEKTVNKGAGDILAKLGYAHFLENDFEKAVYALEKAAENRPLDAEELYLLSGAYTQLGHHDQAFRYLANALEAAKANPESGNDPNFWVILGVAFGRLDQSDKAIECLSQADRLRPGDPKTLRLLWEVLRQSGKYDEALAYLKKAHELNPEDATLLHHLGRAYGRSRQFDKAIEFLEKAAGFLSAGPELAETLYQLGMAHAVKSILEKSAEEKEKAINALKRAMEIDPSDARISSFLEKLQS